MNEFINKLRYYLSKLLVFLGMLNIAEKIAIDIDNPDLKTEKLLVDINFKLDKEDKTIKHLDKAIELAPSEEERLILVFNKANILGELKRYNDALEILKNEDQNDELVLFMVASINLRAANFKLAKKYLKKILNINPKSEEALFSLGIVNYKLGNYNEALKNLNKALDFGYDEKETLSGIISVYLELDDLTEAKKLLKKLKKKYGNDKLVLFTEAKYEYKSNNIKRAYKILENLKPSINYEDLGGDTFYELYNEVKEVMVKKGLLDQIDESDDSKEKFNLVKRLMTFTLPVVLILHLLGRFSLSKFDSETNLVIWLIIAIIWFSIKYIKRFGKDNNLDKK
ncbi:tetratricopeptide repeat protein [Natroniella sp. ANB-PHB2]|uniref:tetratricopeptide repeat protein n=1 Tax=Natroniella sp. ANB-PHB2 TaxID=3384444 RepID=UPI0038D479C8